MASNEVARSLKTSFGATLLGTFFSATLYGLTIYQTYRYYRTYTIDRWSLKALVFALCYTFLVNHFGDAEALLVSNWSFRLSILVVAGPPLLSNSFYISRLWIIGMRNFVFLAVISALMLTRFSFQMALTVMANKYHVISEFRNYYWMVQAYCGASLAADVLLAVFFCWTLHKRRTGYARTDSKIDLLMIYSINTGSLTSVLCLLSLMSVGEGEGVHDEKIEEDAEDYDIAIFRLSHPWAFGGGGIMDDMMLRENDFIELSRPDNNEEERVLTEYVDSR
ncbi:hypothetical protein NMY22_g17435 [Coprinellus aureogranulatus]|nr:hypothetical protein NMY22_g17435 [Coprinellus aureogranulatus]